MNCATMYEQFQEARRSYGASAYGNHYLFLEAINRFGVRPKLDSSAEIVDYVEHVITYGESPDVKH